MKKLKRFITFIVLLTAFITVTAQAPPKPNSGNDPTGNGNTPVGDNTGNSAPIGGGVAMLLAMGAAYGGKKYYDYRRKYD